MLTIIIQNVDKLSLKTCLKICWNFLLWRPQNWEATNFKLVALGAKASTSVWAITVLVEMGRLVEERGFMTHAKSSSPQKSLAFKSPTLVWVSMGLVLCLLEWFGPNGLDMCDISASWNLWFSFSQLFVEMPQWSGFLVIWTVNMFALQMWFVLSLALNKISLFLLLGICDF